MNEQEAKEQLNRVFTAFPSYAAYVRKQDDPVATVRAWCQMLSKCNVEDLQVVVDSVLHGETDVRHKFDTMDMLPVVLRGRAMRMKEDRARFKRTDELATAAKQRKNKPDKFKYHLGKLLAECRRSGEALRSGKITKEQHEATVVEVRRKARIQAD